ncbi:MAG TPA: molybdopterin cofactor-binding domain-containing protein [Tepidisphaeraceae bacterium]
MEATITKTIIPSDITRRGFVKLLGAGLLIAVSDGATFGQARPRRGGGGRTAKPVAIAARVHIARDGTITVMTGKVECGQGARAELTQAAAEELRVPADQIHLIMADTSLVPDDGLTAGSGTTPRTVPSVRQGAAAARAALIAIAAQKWGVAPDQLDARDGKVTQASPKREITYGELAGDEEAAKEFAKDTPKNVTLTPVSEWKVLGTPLPRPQGRDLVTGGHAYPSDITRPGMLYGKVLRPIAYGAKLTSIDLGPAKAMKDVTAVQDGEFVGVAAPTSFLAEQALEAIAKTAQWERPTDAPSSKQLFEYLKQHARDLPKNTFAAADPSKSLKATYNVAYIQHAPLEPRTAVAAWDGDKLTVWHGTQNPFGVRSELMRALGLAADAVRMIVPDFGGGFGGKHTGEAAVEAARLAKAAGRPVSLRWTRKEEFTWAYFRPAGVIEIEASLDPAGKLATWHHVNINSGPQAMETPYRTPQEHSQFVQSKPPLRHGSYRALASTANTFAREVAIDELAVMAGADPFAFRLAHLQDERLKGVLEAAAKRFDWAGRSARKDPKTGVGLACGTEKGGFIATCAEVRVDDDGIAVTHVAGAFDCGKVLNPGNLLNQIQGAIIMGMGAALREEMVFQNGVIRNGSFGEYRPPRFADVPTLDVELVDRPDHNSAGAGESPIMAIAPAIANAVFRATGERVREMPIKLKGKSPQARSSTP